MRYASSITGIVGELLEIDVSLHKLDDMSFTKAFGTVPGTYRHVRTIIRKLILLVARKEQTLTEDS